jgi:hypothetical protein
MTEREQVQQFVREREANGPVECDVPDCLNRWRGHRKLGFKDTVTGEMAMIVFFLCKGHLKMPYDQLLKVCPTGIPGFDTAVDPNMQ